MEERPPVLSLGLDLQASLKKRLDRLGMPPVESRFERVDARPAQGVGVGAGRDQGPGRVGLPFRGRPVERRESVRVGRLDIGAAGDEERRRSRGLPASLAKWSGVRPRASFSLTTLGSLATSALTLARSPARTASWIWPATGTAAFLPRQLPGDGVADLLDGRALEAVAGRRAAAAGAEEDALLDQRHFVRDTDSGPAGRSTRPAALTVVFPTQKEATISPAAWASLNEFQDRRVFVELPPLRAAGDDQGVESGEVHLVLNDDVAAEDDVPLLVVAAPVFAVEADSLHRPAAGLDLLGEREIGVAEPLAQEDEDVQRPGRIFGGRPPRRRPGAEKERDAYSRPL